MKAANTGMITPGAVSKDIRIPNYPRFIVNAVISVATIPITARYIDP